MKYLQMSTLRPLVLLSGAVAILLAVSGCANGQSDAKAPTPAATATSSIGATPTPGPDSNAVAAISMSAEGLSVVSASGAQLSMIRYTDDPAASVALLAEALQSEPTLSPGGRINYSGGILTNYRWGGIILQTDQDPDDPSVHWMGANFVAPSFGAVNLLGPGGLSVGDSTAAAPDPISTGSYEGSPNGPRYLLGEPQPSDLSDGQYFAYVQAYDDPSAITIIELVAPAFSYGGPGWEVLTYTGRA